MRQGGQQSESRQDSVAGSNTRESPQPGGPRTLASAEASERQRFFRGQELELAHDRQAVTLLVLSILRSLTPSLSPTLFVSLSEPAEPREGERQSGHWPVGSLGAHRPMDLLKIRAHNSAWLREFTVGTAVGVRSTRGRPTNTPAVLAFVPYKVESTWVPREQVLPRRIRGPGSTWCDLDVLEFNPVLQDEEARGVPKDTVFNQLVESFRGGYTVLGPGSQVMSWQGVFATMGPLVRGQDSAPPSTGTPAPPSTITGGQHQGTAPRGGQSPCSTSGREGAGGGGGGSPTAEGFLTTAKLFRGEESSVGERVFHPQTPTTGMGKAIGTVQEDIQVVSDVRWFGAYASEREDAEVQVDTAFVAFDDGVDRRRLTSDVPGLPGEVGDLFSIGLHLRPQDLAGKMVAKVGRSSGLTFGVIVAYAVEYFAEEGRTPLLMDLLIEGHKDAPFSMCGDAGAMVLLQEQGTGSTNGDPGSEPLWRPLGMVWPFTSQCGRTHFGDGLAPSFWSSAVDLGRALDVLQLELCPIHSTARSGAAAVKHVGAEK